MAGLDPTERVRFRTLIASLTADRTVLLSTHIIADIEAGTDRVVLLKGGRLLADTTTSGLLQRARGHVWEIRRNLETARRLQASQPISSLVTGPEGVLLRLVADTAPLPEARPADPSLEDAYLLAIR